MFYYEHLVIKTFIIGFVGIFARLVHNILWLFHFIVFRDRQERRLCPIFRKPLVFLVSTAFVIGFSTVALPWDFKKQSDVIRNVFFFFSLESNIIISTYINEYGDDISALIWDFLNIHINNSFLYFYNLENQ